MSTRAMGRLLLLLAAVSAVVSYASGGWAWSAGGVPTGGAGPARRAAGVAPAGRADPRGTGGRGGRGATRQHGTQPVRPPADRSGPTMAGPPSTGPSPAAATAVSAAADQWVRSAMASPGLVGLRITGTVLSCPTDTSCRAYLTVSATSGRTPVTASFEVDETARAGSWSVVRGSGG